MNCEFTKNLIILNVLKNAVLSVCSVCIGPMLGWILKKSHTLETFVASAWDFCLIRMRLLSQKDSTKMKHSLGLLLRRNTLFAFMEKPVLTNSLREMSGKDVFVQFQSMSSMI